MKERLMLFCGDWQIASLQQSPLGRSSQPRALGLVPVSHLTGGRGGNHCHELVASF